MSIFEAIILGILQGVAEFLPISSSGHLILIPWLTGWQPMTLTFGVFVHAGTMVGTLFYFWRDWWAMVQGGVKWVKTRERNADFTLLLLLMAGTIPAALVGLLFEDVVDAIFGKPLIAAIGLIFTAGILYAGEKLGKGAEGSESLGFIDALLIGLAQMIAIIPGISRSGSTLTAGRLRGLKREEAARFSFLLSTPVIAGAALIELIRFATGTVDLNGLPMLIIGFASAAISSYFVIGWLLSYLKKRSTTVFAIYCLVFACVNIVVFLLRG